MFSEKPVIDWKKLSVETVAQQSGVARMLRFGAFELNITTGELRKHGRKIRLQGQSLKILLCLLEEPGQPRSREELRCKLWPSGTFVDFDHSLNVAVNRLRSVWETQQEPRAMSKQWQVPATGSSALWKRMISDS